MRQALFLIAFCTAVAAGAQTPPPILTPEQAQTLVTLAFEHQIAFLKGRHGPYFPQGYYPAGFDERYYWFDVLGGGPGSVNLGRFAVNKLTGEVWDTFLDCHVVHFPALTRMQRDLRRRDGLSAHEPPGTPHRGEKPRAC
jgi:hypothetical protein